jgi:hypothetical protein
MAIQITDRNYSTRNHSAGNSFLLANSGQIITEVVTFNIGFNFTSSVQNPIIFVDEYTMQIVGKTWQELGFAIGNTIELTGVLEGTTTITYSAYSVTITDVSGDTVTVGTTLDPSSSGLVVGQVAPAAGNTPLLVVNDTVTAPESIEFFHNLIPNSQNAGTGSLIDNEVNRFLAEGVDAMSVTDTITMEQLGNKSGGSYIDVELERIADVGSNTAYTVTLRYCFPYKFEDGEFDQPSWAVGSGSLKPYYLIKALPEANNPNSALQLIWTNQLGNVGWTNESYNQGANDFTIDTVTLETVSGQVLDEVDFNQNTTVQAVISSDANFADWVEVEFYLLPDTDYYKNKADRNCDLIHLSNSFADTVVAGDTFGAGSATMLVNNLGQTLGTNEITIDFDLEPSAEFTALMESWGSEQRRYRITATVETAGGDENENNSVTLILKEGILENAPVIGGTYSNVTFNGFFNHSQDLTGVSEVIYNGCTEDDILYHSKFNLKNDAEWQSLELSLRVVRDSDGQYFELFNRLIPFTSYVTDVDGVIHIDYLETIQQFLDSTDRNKIQVNNTGFGTSLDYEVQIIWSMMANWRYWVEQSNALIEFFDTSLPQNGRNAEWMRYLREAGYSLKVRCTLTNDQNVAFYWGSQLNLQDYDDTTEVTTDIELYDNTDTLQTALIQGQLMTIKAIHTLDSGAWDTDNVWGWISIRPFEAESNKRISTEWTWTTQNNPLKPESGETGATISFPSSGVAVVECKVDASLIDASNYTIVARIESPIFPECISPIDYLFDAVIAGSDYETDYVSVMEKFLTNGLDVSHSNICCPECLVELKVGGDELYLYAFGRKSLVEGVEGAIVAECCKDVYGIAEVCTTDFDDVWDTLEAGLDGISLLDLVPSQMNTYGDTDLGTLTLRVFDLTTDEVIRWQLMNMILRTGILVTCNPDTGAKTIKEIAL